MKIKKINDLSIYYLDKNEYEDAELKNHYLQQTETSYVAFAVAGGAEEDDILWRYNREIDLNDSFVIAFCRGTQSSEIDYAGVFQLLSTPPCALLFPKQLVKTAGMYNEKLSALTDFELLCRFIRETNKCVLSGAVQIDDLVVIGEQWAYTSAYIFRSHLNSLHLLGLTDSVFRLFCKNMEEKGILADFQRQINLFLSDEKSYERIARKTAPFIVLRGDDTCSGVMQKFADDLCDALTDCGQAVIKVDDRFMEHEKIQNMICKGIVGFQTTALEIDFFRKIHGPKFQFWFDNPLHFKNILRNLPEEYYILCQDANYASLIREYYHTENAIQFPPGGIMRENKHTERPYDIVFIGSYFADRDDFLKGEAESFYDYMLKNPGITFEQGIRDLFYGGQEEADRDDFVEKAVSLKPVCRMVIGHFRNAVITTILEAGFTLHVYGDDWKNYKAKEDYKLIIHPNVTVEESLEELSKAKIGLNVMSWHKAGMTERIANIMLSGAVCLSEETSYLRDHMVDGKDIVSFKLTQLDRLPDMISRLLSDAETRERIAANAYQKAMTEYTWHSRAKQLVELSENVDKVSLNIYVATHVKFIPPANPIYIPLHVGRYGKPDLGYLGDDTGENISDLNFLYGELTGLFWIWQNVDDVDYVGICHYRRYFINSARKEMQKRDYIDLLEQYDAIVPKHMQCEESYYEHFGRAHNSRDLDAVGRTLKRLYPDYADAYEQAMQGHIFYYGNLMVTKLSVLKSYAEWLFTIFAEAGEEIDVSGYDDYHKRVYGFLSEQMFYVFLLANGLTYCEVAVGISEEKAETRALKELLKQLLTENKLTEARELFDAQMKIRPDLLLPNSDVNGELQAIYRQLI